LSIVTTAVNPALNVPRLEFLYRAAGATDWISKAVPAVDPSNTYMLNFDDVNTGVYELAVRPREAVRNTLADPTHIVTITIDNELNATFAGSNPAANGTFNGESFTVQFAIQPDSDGHIDNINRTNVKLYWRFPIDPENWNYDVTASSIHSNDGVNYTAEFTNVSPGLHLIQTNDGYYDFKVEVADMAVSPNLAGLTILNVLYDSTKPYVEIAAPTDLNIVLGENVNILALAYDVSLGQGTAHVSGIEKVEFYYTYAGVENMIGEALTAPYTVDWNTTGLQAGNYPIRVVAWDYAGNFDVDNVDINLYAPGYLQPYAVIKAMNFDPITGQLDKIYAEIDPRGAVINSVAFDYSVDGIAWTQFAQQTPTGNTVTALFDAALINANVSQIRTRVFYDGNIQSER
ncbi:MAG: Ig-like domain-containing protein, partial [Candidatus Cloacimonadaceae bacterium]|nr:Ig-like domain-containing protein [Candidatus Cloacimonadaceae bacterium]